MTGMIHHFAVTSDSARENLCPLLSLSELYCCSGNIFWITFSYVQQNV